MKQQGNIEEQELVDLIEDLVTARKEGYLYLKTSNRRMLLGIEPDGIELVADSRVEWQIDRILVDRAEISRQQHKQAKGIAEETKKDIENVLEAKGFAGKNQFENAVRTQAKESLLDAFLLRNGSFEFREIEEPPSVDEAYRVPFKFSFDPDPLLQEANDRKTKFEQFKKVVSDPDQIYQLDRNQLPRKENEAESEKQKQVVEAIEEAMPVRRLLDNLNYSLYEVYNVLSELHRSDAMHELSGEELLENAREKLEQEEVSLAVDLFEKYLENHPNDRKAHEEYAGALSADGEGEKASNLLFDVATSYLKEEEPEQAQALLKRAYENNPENQQVRDTWFDTVLDLNDPERIRETGGTLIHSYTDAGDVRRAEDVLDRLLNRFPESVRLLMVGAELAKRQGKTNKMNGYIERAVDALSDDVKKSRQDTIDYLKDTAEDPEEMETAIRSVVGGGWFGRIFTLPGLATIGLIVVIGGLIAAIGWHHMEVRAEYYDLESRVQVALAKGNKQQAISYYTQFINENPISVYRIFARRKIKSLKSSKTSDVDISDKETSEGDLEKAITNLKAEALNPEKETPYRKLIEELSNLEEKTREQRRHKLTERIRKLKKKLQTEEKKATELLQQAREHLSKKEWEQARSAFDRIRTDYSRTHAAKKVLYPVKFSSLPPGVNVQIDGKKLGTTPFVHSFSTNQPRNITISRPYYETKSRIIDPTEKLRFELFLKKTIEWERDLTSSLATRPVFLSDTILVGMKNGTVWAGYSDRRERWGRQIDNQPVLEHVLAGAGKTAYFLSRKGRLISLRTDGDGNVDWSLKLDGNTFYQPVFDHSSRHLFVPARPNRVHLVDVEQKRIRTTLSLGSDPIAPVLVRNHSLYVVTENGTLSRFQITKEGVTKAFSFPFHEGDAIPSSQVITEKGQIWILMENGELWSVDPETKTAKKQKTFDGSADYDLSYDGSVIAFALQNGYVYLYDVQKKDVRIKSELLEAPAAQPTFDRTMMYTVDQTRQIRAYNRENGTIYWTKRLPRGQVVGPPEVHDDFLLYGTDKGFLYLIRK